MPAIDECQPQIVRALEREGWTIQTPPLLTGNDGFSIYIDIFASKEDISAYIEVKCLTQEKTNQDLYNALGQYIIYRAFLVKWRQSASLYLAVLTTAYDELFVETIQEAVQDNQIRLIVVDLKQEKIVRWIE